MAQLDVEACDSEEVDLAYLEQQHSQHGLWALAQVGLRVQGLCWCRIQVLVQK